MTSPLHDPQSSLTNAERILLERARRLAQVPPETSAAGETLELATFHLGSEFMGIPTHLVHETQPLHAHHWTYVPGAPAFVAGAVNLRGHIYSILDLARFLGLPPRPLAEKAHLLLVRGGLCADGKEMELTLLADDRPAIRPVPLASLNPPPATLSPTLLAYLRGVTPDLLLVLDLERLLSDPQLIVHEEV
jgi:purine-binding chemotaxis protein CheW